MRALCNPPVASERAGFSGRCSGVGHLADETRDTHPARPDMSSDKQMCGERRHAKYHLFIDDVCCKPFQKLPQHSRRIQLEHHRPSRCHFRVTRATERGIFDKAALGDSPLPPWLFGFQCNERYLKWDASAQIQLLKIHAAREMGKVCLVLRI